MEKRYPSVIAMLTDLLSEAYKNLESAEKEIEMLKNKLGSSTSGQPPIISSISTCICGNVATHKYCPSCLKKHEAYIKQAF